MRQLIYSVMFAFSVSQSFAYEDIIEKLEKYSEVKINTEKCKDNERSDGWYEPAQNLIHFCVDNIISGWPPDKHESVLRKVLLHEAVHLAQDCKAGLANVKMVKIDERLLPVPPFVAKFYPRREHQIEAEAFHYWHKGNAPIQLVEDNCS